MKYRKIKIYGKVQGVFYRASTIDIVREIGDIKGFVKNENDGTVLIKASGPDDKIDRLIEWCKQGPEYAKVDKVEVSDTEPFEVDGFTITR